jgi:signal transduction histidine kinase
LMLGNLQTAHLLILALVVLLCYALAYHLTAPLRRLQKALDHFGRGDLDARAQENRHDELGDLARAFDRMADRIQTLLAAERRLLLDISHELRSPLARLSVAVELARSGENALPLDRIQKEADRLNALISQMLEVTRVENDASHRKQEHVALDQLVGGLVDDCSIEASARGCSLSFAAPPHIAMDGDPELLRRAIENVVRNAIRHAPAGSKIEIAVENGGGRIRVRVRDYGPGVPEQALPHLFDPFYRVEPDRNRGSGGVGLGLSIARRAVELHQGTLRASNVAPGLLVEIELPA